MTDETAKGARDDEAAEHGARGISRTLRGAGGVGALTLALLWARTHIPPMVDAWLAAHPPHTSPDLAWMPPPSATELAYGQTNPRTFTMTIEVVLVAALAWFGIETLVSRFLKAPRWVPAALGGLVAAAGVLSAFQASKLAGAIALGIALPAALLYARYEPGGDPSPSRPSHALEASVLVLEAIALAWGIWLTCWTEVGILSLLVLVALAVAAAFRAARDLAGSDGARALERDAIVGSPLLLLAFLGMRRDPSPVWVVAALAASVAVALALLRWRPPFAKVMTALAAVAAPCALVAVFLMPMHFREVGSIDHYDHESQHLGWINSIGFGRLMMADSGYIYGPLREYLLALYCALGGMTLEHVREAHVWANFVGVALMLYAGWRVSGGRPWLHFWWVHVLLAHTALVFLVHYRDQLSFGWVDIARSGFACLALVGGAQCAAADDREAPPWRDFARAHRPLILWGALCGVAALYSQDYGPCALGSVGLAIIADSGLRRGLGSLWARTIRALRLGLAWSAGALAVLLAFFLVYACFGKALLMVHRLVTWTGLILGGGWSGGEWPLKTQDWISPALIGHYAKFVAIDYSTPAIFIAFGGVVVALAAARRAWTARVTLIFALFLFAFTTVRHVMIRPDIYHARSDGTGGVLLFFALMCDLSQVRWYFRRASLPIGAVAVAFLAVGWTVVVEGWQPIRDKVHALVTGDESPQHGAPFQNADVPRAGDVDVPGNVKALVHYVDATTKPSDPVWVTMTWMTGGAYQFVIDRRNPTPFDVAHELTTHGDQAELQQVLEHDPPVLIVGDYFNLIGDHNRDYIEAHWKRENVPGYGSVRRFDPSSFN
jgi:hypothetical protein